MILLYSVVHVLHVSKDLSVAFHVPPTGIIAFRSGAESSAKIIVKGQPEQS